jgi:hypothetical protein
MRSDNNLRRGLPVLASETVGEEFAQDLTASSAKYGTQFRYDREQGQIYFSK